MAYSGQPVLLEALLFKAKHNLIDQSMCSKSAGIPTNGDGFGVGWYAEAKSPGIFRSIRPAWNDFNLHDLLMAVAPELVPYLLGSTDGESLYAVRYASDGDAPTLYHNRDIEAVCHLNPDLRHRVGPDARAIVSEPIGMFPEIWQAVPQNSSLQVKDACFETRPFLPLA